MALEHPAVQAGEAVDLKGQMPADECREILAAFETHGRSLLTPVHEALGGRYSFEQLRLARIIHGQTTTAP
ncbi:MAG: helix-turn-helix domain-containing protein [Verrucomicrobiales bacterium]|nr:helix-turn-helix domain-containing protein [Verrucomicrobiales bacterium]MCP5527318.1 helix-turn-helix domain-containing protein [Verrucomicrobiales bacterium]